MKTSASWNPFAQNSDKAGIVGSQGRDDYEAEDVEYYFNYMGILADEGSNDRMDALVEAGKHPIDIILLFAAAEGGHAEDRGDLRGGRGRERDGLGREHADDVSGEEQPGEEGSRGGSARGEVVIGAARRGASRRRDG